MAEVFLGSMLGAEGFSRRVAIKRVLPGFSDNASFAQMFVSEAQISSRLVHPNIVSVLDFDRDPDGRLFLVMELVDGRDLDALAASGPLPIPVIIFVISEVLRGLGHAHDLSSSRDLRGIVHRDVSPHNVLLSWQGAVKVSDFGIAKAREATEVTGSVFIKGKPAYMSPEQANGQPLDGRSDLFAVGVMLWEMLAGRRLFVGEDTRATLAAVLFGQIPRPRSLRSDVPKDLERVAMKLLERDLPARYGTAELALHDLLECKDAPKNGREQLVRVLAERFPKHTRARPSATGSQAQVSAPPAGGTPSGYQRSDPQAQTISERNYSGTGPPAMPEAQQVSIGGFRNSPTGTMVPMKPATPMAMIAPRRRGMRIALVGVGLLAAGLIAFAVLAAMRNKSSASGGAVTADAAVPAPPKAPVVHEAAPPDAAEPPVPSPVDPAPVPAPAPPPKKDASVGHSSEKRMGHLVVRAFPVLTVYVDNKKIHDTPVDMKLPVGKHKLRLVNSEVGKDESVNVTIEENKTATIERN